VDKKGWEGWGYYYLYIVEKDGGIIYYSGTQFLLWKILHNNILSKIIWKFNANPSNKDYR